MHNIASINLVIFDFDFTLADASAGIILSMNTALKQLGFPEAEDEDIRRTVGLPLSTAVRNLTGIDNPEIVADFLKAFREKADEVMAPSTRIYDKAIKAVKTLRDSGILTAIVSTKYRFRIEDTLERRGFSDMFDLIVGGEDVIAPKPDPSGLKLALSKMDVSSENAIYVGDHVVDAEAAKQCGIRFIAVLTGTSLRADFAEYESVAILDNLSQLDITALG